MNDDQRICIYWSRLHGCFVRRSDDDRRPISVRKMVYQHTHTIVNKVESQIFPPTTTKITQHSVDLRLRCVFVHIFTLLNSHFGVGICVYCAKNRIQVCFLCTSVWWFCVEVKNRHLHTKTHFHKTFARPTATWC